MEGLSIYTTIKVKVIIKYLTPTCATLVVKQNTMQEEENEVQIGDGKNVGKAINLLLNCFPHSAILNNSRQKDKYYAHNEIVG